MGREACTPPAIEDNLIALNRRLDDFTAETRQRFRVLNERLAGAA